MDTDMVMDTVTDMEMRKRSRICLFMIRPKYICICLLWIVCIWPVYAQNISSREQQMQDRLESYVQTLSSRKESSSKMNVLVLPVVGFHPSQLSYGLMVGVMKRTGGYVKAKYSFSKVTGDSFECDDEGVSGADGQTRWYTGRTEKSRMAVTGGIVQRLWKPIYLYAGAGYGTRVQVWETVSGTWGKNKDHSYEGVEAEIGGIVAFKHFVFSLGVQTNSFEYLEGNLGIGVIF